MKKIIFTCTMATAAFTSAYAQSWQASGPDLYSDPITTKVGIGLPMGATMIDMLNVDGNVSFSPASTSRRISGRSDKYLEIYGNSGLNDGSAFVLGADGAPGYDGLIRMIAGGSTPNNDVAMDLLHYNGGSFTGLFNVLKNGTANFSGQVQWFPAAAKRSIVAQSSWYLELFGNTSQATGAGLVLGSNGAPGYDGLVRMIAGGNSSSPDVAMDLLIYDGGAHTGLFNVLKNGTANFNGTLQWFPSSYKRGIAGRSSAYLEVYGNDGFATGAGMVLGANGSVFDGEIKFIAGGNTSTSNAFTLSQYNNGAYTPLMYVRKDGKMVIGNADPNTPFDYKLYVEKGILTSRVKVAMPGSDWSDYVFAEDYQLMPLNEVAQFIATNKHLPSIPSAEEVDKDGIDLGAMDARLLQKIEELTLYVIELQKQNEHQQAQIEDLKRTK